MRCRFVAMAMLLASGSWVVGCGGGGGGAPASDDPGNAAPLVSVSQPVANLTLSRGATFRVEFVDSDPDDIAFTTVYLDGDGDPSTTGDLHEVADPFLEHNGVLVELDVTPEPGTVPAGTYHVLAVSADFVNPVVVAEAPGLLTYVDVGFVAADLGKSYVPTGGSGPAFGSVVPSACAAYADGASVEVGGVVGRATFNADGAGETTLLSEPTASLYVARRAADGALGWVVRVPISQFGSGAVARSVAALPDGGCVIVGEFADVIVFGAGEAHETTLSAGTAQSALFIARYGADGQLAFARGVGSTGRFFRGLDVDAAPDGSFVLAGSWNGPAVFGAGEANETTLDHGNRTEAFVARYAADGTFLWVRTAQTGANLDPSPTAVAAFPDGSCAVVGRTTMPPTTFSPGLSDQVIDQRGEGWLARYGADGSLQWVEPVVRLQGGVLAHDVRPLPDGAVALLGEATGSVAAVLLGDAQPRATTLPAGGYLARFDAAGMLTWARPVPRPMSLATYADGSFALVGSFDALTGPVRFGQGGPNDTTLYPHGGSFSSVGSDIWLARLDAVGEALWATQAGGTCASLYPKVAAVPDGSAVVVGALEDRGVTGKEVFVDPLGPTPTSVVLLTESSSNVLLFRCNADGHL